MSDCRTCEYAGSRCYCPPERDCTAYKKKEIHGAKHTFEFETSPGWEPDAPGCWASCPFSFNIKTAELCKCREDNRIKCQFVGNLDKGGKVYNTHEVAEILADFVHTNCACDYPGIAEWLSDKCDMSVKECDLRVGVTCWEQYLKHLNDGKV